MSAQEVRNEIIRENLPKLIRELTNLEDGENARRCEQFALATIRNHRNMSTNSHEVRRKIENIQNKFTVDNSSEYAEHLGRLCDEVIQHPLCVEHYEVDVHWSLLDLLFTLAYNPTGALKRNKHNIDLTRPAVCDETEKEQSKADYWKNVLKEDFIPMEHFNNSDSELSDWSDDLNEDKTVSVNSDASLSMEDSCISPKSSNTEFSSLKPPEKEIPFTQFDSARSEDRLLHTVQHSWWNQKSKFGDRTTTDSECIAANFALIYSKFLSETSNNLIGFEEPSTVSEYCLMRELLWMFHSPEKCKFFSVTNNGIKLRENVSIPSVTVTGLASFLEQKFLPYISMMQTLRKFMNSIYDSDNFTPPKTLECYAANLRSLLKPIWQTLLDYEDRLLRQQDFVINTIITLHECLRETLKKLECIHEVHQKVIVNLQQTPAHISSSFLLASLMHCTQVASNAMESNFAMSLFLASVKVFCAIMDVWWTEGRLDDWQKEFVVESTNNSDQHNISVRKYRKNKEKAFFVSSHVSKMIRRDSFFNLLVDHSLEAGCTLNLLYDINRIGHLRNTCVGIEDKLYNVFIDDVMTYVRTMQSEAQIEGPSVRSSDSAFLKDTVDSAGCIVSQVQSSINQDVINRLTTADEFLLRAFTSNMDLGEDESDAALSIYREQPVAWNALNIFQRLEQQNPILPLDEVIVSSLTRILKKRIASANSFIIQLYREEYGILKHLRNIRKVLLLEASDLMHQFYDKLFKQIEDGITWANPFQLSIQLGEILGTRFPEMSTLFRLEINSTIRSETKRVSEAVEEISVTYNFSRELSHIITQSDIQEYNKVFRFLLKVKWGLITLENLESPRIHRRRLPYAPFDMIDLQMRRLQQLRFWMIYAIQSIHFHLMTHVLQAMGEQLDEKISKCTNLQEMIMVHKSYVSTVREHCFLDDNFNTIKLGVEQMLNLTLILKMEWESCCAYIKSNGPLSLDLSESTSNCDPDQDYIKHSQIDGVELTYIRCHQYLANRLNNEVYLNQNTFLSGLSDAFNTSLPY